MVESDFFFLPSLRKSLSLSSSFSGEIEIFIDKPEFDVLEEPKRQPSSSYYTLRSFENRNGYDTSYEFKNQNQRDTRKSNNIDFDYSTLQKISNVITAKCESLDTKEKHCINLEKTCANLKEQISEKDEELKRNTKKMKENDNDLECLKSELNVLKKDVENYQWNYFKQAKDLELESKKLNMKELECKKMEEKYKSLQAAVKRNEETTLPNIELFNEIMSDLKILKEKIETCQKKNFRRKSKLSKISDDLNDKINELEAKGKILRTVDKNINYELTISSLKEKIETSEHIEKELDDTKKRISDLQKELEVKDLETKQYLYMIEKINNKLFSTKEELEGCKKDYNETNFYLNKVSKDLEARCMEIDERKNKFSKLEDECQNLKRELAIKNDLIKEKNYSIQQTMDQLSSMEDSLENHRKQSQQCELSLNMLTDAYEENCKILEEKSLQCRVLTEALENLEVEGMRHNSETTKLRDDVEALCNELEEKDMAYLMLEENYLNDQKIMSDLLQKTSEQNLEEKKALECGGKLRDQLEILETENKRHLSDIAKLNKDFKAQIEELKIKDAAYLALEEKHLNDKKELSNLLETVEKKSKEEKTLEYCSLLAKIETLEAKNRSYELDITKLHEDIEAKNEALEIKDSAYLALEEKCLKDNQKALSDDKQRKSAEQDIEEKIISECRKLACRQPDETLETKERHHYHQSSIMAKLQEDLDEKSEELKTKDVAYLALEEKYANAKKALSDSQKELELVNAKLELREWKTADIISLESDANTGEIEEVLHGFQEEKYHDCKYFLI